MFLKGDKVKFLDDVGGGVVTRVERNVIYVRNNDGFEIPVQASQLLKTEERAASHPFVAATESVPDETPVSVGYVDLSGDGENHNASVNILLAWTADRRKTEDTAYHVHLINDCSYHVMYVATMLKEGVFHGIQAGMLESDSLIHLADIRETELKNIHSLQLHILFFKQGVFLPQEPLSYSLDIDGLFLSDITRYQSNGYLDEKALLYNVTEKFLMAEIEKAAQKAPKEAQRKLQADAPRRPQHKEPESVEEEVDLHIEQLTDYPERLSAGEMLDIQTARFHVVLEGALRGNRKRIVFIHGVGNGRLRLEIRRIIDKQYPQLRYQDASFKEYGYGATLVFCK
ncbi:MAG: DUF2027 domain-containing protein [Bacteroidales bacterium]|jgi:hypothetical protein|nr:DUF2027 domain-containing protein [Bacteroidales bacterium]